MISLETATNFLIVETHNDDDNDDDDGDDDVDDDINSNSDDDDNNNNNIGRHLCLCYIFPLLFVRLFVCCFFCFGLGLFSFLRWGEGGGAL